MTLAKWHIDPGDLAVCWSIDPGDSHTSPARLGAWVPLRRWPRRDPAWQLWAEGVEDFANVVCRIDESSRLPRSTYTFTPATDAADGTVVTFELTAGSASAEGDEAVLGDIVVRSTFRVVAATAPE